MEGYSFTHLALLRESSWFRMKMIARRDQVCVIVLMILTIHSMFLFKKCHGQFHWGKNYRLEAQQLRDMFARYKFQKNATTTPAMMVRKNIEVKPDKLL